MFGLAHAARTMWTSAVGRGARRVGEKTMKLGSGACYLAKQLVVEPAPAANAQWRLPTTVPTVVGVGAIAWLYDAKRHVEPEVQVSLLLSPEKPRSVLSQAWSWCFDTTEFIDNVVLELWWRNPLWFHSMDIDVTQVKLIVPRTDLCDAAKEKFENAAGEKETRHTEQPDPVYVHEDFEPPPGILKRLFNLMPVPVMNKLSKMLYMASVVLKKMDIDIGIDLIGLKSVLESSDAGMRGSKVVTFKSVPAGSGVAVGYVSYEYSKFRWPSWFEAKAVFNDFIKHWMMVTEIPKVALTSVALIRQFGPAVLAAMKDKESSMVLDMDLEDVDDGMNAHVNKNAHVDMISPEEEEMLNKLEEYFMSDAKYFIMRFVLREAWCGLFWTKEMRMQEFAVPISKRGEKIVVDKWGGAANAPAILASLSTAAAGTS